MSEFRKPYGRGGGGGGGNRRPSFGGQRDENREMFPAVCDSCHKSFQLPFRPNGKKPVYCSECFAAQRGEAPQRDTRPARSFERRDRDFGGSSRPTAPMPQTSSSQNTDREIAALKRQMDIVTTKLDTILRVIESKPESKPKTDVGTVTEVPKEVQMLTKPIPKEKLASSKKKKSTKVSKKK